MRQQIQRPIEAGDRLQQPRVTAAQVDEGELPDQRIPTDQHGGIECEPPLGVPSMMNRAPGC